MTQIVLLYLVIKVTTYIGYCRASDGEDVKDHRKIAEIGTRPSLNKSACLHLCQNEKQATGCEWNGDLCNVHIDQKLAKGNGDLPVTCWKFGEN